MNKSCLDSADVHAGTFIAQMYLGLLPPHPHSGKVVGLVGRGIKTGGPLVWFLQLRIVNCDLSQNSFILC